MSFILISDATVLAKMGIELSQAIRDTDERIHQYLLSEIVHIETHRNPTRLNQFLSRVRGSGTRVNAMHNFVQVFANVKLNEEANSAIQVKNGVAKIKEVKGQPSKFGRIENGEAYAVWYSVKPARKTYIVSEKVDGKMVNNKVTAEEYFEFAMSKPWYEFQPERPVTEFNLNGKVIGLLRSAMNEAVANGSDTKKEFLMELLELSFKHGIVQKPSDVLSDALIAKVPADWKPALHMVDTVAVEPAPIEAKVKSKGKGAVAVH